MNFQVTKKSLRNILVGVSALTLCATIATTGINSVLEKGPDTANAVYKDGGDGGFKTAEGKSVHWTGSNEKMEENGFYKAHYRFTTPSGDQETHLKLKTEAWRCDRGNGHPKCVDGTPEIKEYDVTLNASNSYEFNLEVTTQQRNNVKCGSIQTDVYSDTGELVAWTIYSTDKDMSTCLPTQSPSPSPSVSPSPSPSMSPSPKPSASPSPKPSASPSPASSIQCPVGKKAEMKNSVMVCVDQNQNQNQNQTQNNNQNQTVNTTANATGGNSTSNSSSNSSSSVNLTINNPETVREVVKEVTVSNTPQVVAQTKGEVKELPKTGLPLAGLALAGLLPAGAGLKRFGKKDEVSANSVWMERELNS